MALKLMVEKLEDVAEGLRGEYKEVRSASGATSFVLDLDGDIQKHPSSAALRNENAQRRISEKRAMDELAVLAPFKVLGDLAEVQAKLDRLPELEAAAAGKLDDVKINGIVETRIKTKLAPVERERDQLKALVAEKDTAIAGYVAENKRRTITDAVRDAVSKSKGFITHAAEDATVYAERMLEVDESGRVVTKDNVGVTPGVDASVWLQEMQTRKPHWWGGTGGGGSNGSGAGGSGGEENPWTHESWNMTKQGQLVTTDRQKADRLAKAAGTVVGGPRPKPKKAG